MEDAVRFERYVERLTDAEALVLHRIVCRRAGPLYMKTHRNRWEASRPRAQMVRREMAAQRLAP